MKKYYQDEWATIYHGDCREVLPQLPKVPLIVTDPPYGIGEARGKNKSRGCLAVSKDYGFSSWDDSPPPRWMFDLMQEKAERVIIWGGNYFPLPQTSGWLVWDKDNGKTDFADCELAWTNIDMAVRRLKWRWQGMLQENMGSKESRVHPTQKPLAVMKWCLGFCPDVKLVLDPYAGSCTTARAAKDFGIRSISIEAEEQYCEIGAYRLQQNSLFAQLAVEDEKDVPRVESGSLFDGIAA